MTRPPIMVCGDAPWRRMVILLAEVAVLLSTIDPADLGPVTEAS